MPRIRTAATYSLSEPNHFPRLQRCLRNERIIPNYHDAFFYLFGFSTKSWFVLGGHQAQLASFSPLLKDMFLRERPYSRNICITLDLDGDDYAEAIGVLFEVVYTGESFIREKSTWKRAQEIAALLQIKDIDKNVQLSGPTLEYSGSKETVTPVAIKPRSVEEDEDDIKIIGRKEEEEEEEEEEEYEGSDEYIEEMEEDDESQTNSEENIEIVGYKEEIAHRKRYTCNVCGKFSFKNEKLHVLSHYRRPIIKYIQKLGMSRKKCESCDYVYSTKMKAQNMCRHIGITHGLLRKFLEKENADELFGSTLSPMETSFNAYLRVKNHGGSLREDVRVISSPECSSDIQGVDYICYICSKSHDSSITLKLHLVTHFEEKIQTDILSHNYDPNYCIACRKSFNSNQESLNHYAITHGLVVRHLSVDCASALFGVIKSTPIPEVSPWQYTCYLCKKTFSKGPAMRNHFVTHFRQELLDEISLIHINSSICGLCSKPVEIPLAHFGVTHGLVIKYLDKDIAKLHFNKKKFFQTPAEEVRQFVEPFVRVDVPLEPNTSTSNFSISDIKIEENSIIP